MKIVPDPDTQEKIDALDEFREAISNGALDAVVSTFTRLEKIFDNGHSDKDTRKPDEPKEGDNTGSDTPSAS